MLAEFPLFHQTVIEGHHAAQVPILSLVLLRLCRRAFDPDSVNNHQSWADHFPAPCRKAERRVRRAHFR